jgi:hypothetical protein
MPPTLRIGGSQTVALELAAELRRRGHEIVVLAKRGPLIELPDFSRFELIETPTTGRPRPNRRSVLAVRDALRGRGFDVIHSYESVPTIEALVGGTLLSGVPVVASIMSMTVPTRFPKGVPLIVGTEQIGTDLLSKDHLQVAVIEPPVSIPVSTEAKAGPVITSESRRLILVSRIDRFGKLEPILTVIRSVAELSSEIEVTLEIVGGGDAELDVAKEAHVTNEKLGRECVILHGPQVDPFPFYVGREVVLGLGHSVLRGMGMGLAGVVVDTGGYAEAVTPETADHFLSRGFVGDGVGRSNGQQHLIHILRWILSPQERTASLGEFGARLIRDHFDSSGAVDQLEVVLQSTAADFRPHQRLTLDALAALKWLVGIRAKALLGEHGRFEARTKASR